MEVRLTGSRVLRFADGSPVRAASAVAPLGDGWLVAQDDSTLAAWDRGDRVEPLRVLPPVEGLDHFREDDGSKHLKPDLEAACELGHAGVLLLGSGSTPARMRAVLVALRGGEPSLQVADLGPLYARVGEVLGVPPEALNLEGACRSGEVLRWFQRGGAASLSASVDLDVTALLAAVRGERSAADVPVTSPRTYDLGRLDGVGLDVTDAVALPDGRVLVSAAAEDTPNPVDDGPVVAAALALLDGDRVLAVAPLPEPGGVVLKVEGLGLEESWPDGLQLRAVVDADDPDAPSLELLLEVSLP